MTLKSSHLRATLLFIITTFFSCTEIDPNELGALVPKTVDQDATLPSISVNGTMLHAETFGNPNNSMVIFLHGGPGADYRNALNVKQLADNGYFVVFYDQRGAGLSKRHKKNIYTMQIMIDDLNAIIDYYRSSTNQKVFLFGHSWGGILATAFINQYPNKLNGAILAEPGGFTFDEIKNYVENTKELNFFDEASNDALYINQFLTGSENQHQILDYKLAMLSAFSYGKGNKEGIEGFSPFWRYGFASFSGLYEYGEENDLNISTNLNQFNPKILFLYSENNSAYGIKLAQHLSNYYTHKEIREIKGTGHEMIYFKWNNVYPFVLSYLNSLN
jgi:proline iminopeptidase